MTDNVTLHDKTVETAKSYETVNPDDLVLLLARQDKAIADDPSLAQDPTLDPNYDDPTLDLAALKSLGQKILKEWNKRLYQLVCESSDDESRKKLIDAAGIGETALIGAVASVLLTIANPAIAAAAAAVIVKSFLIPAGGVVCDSWKEAIELDL
ncbi:MAG: hypothetical protein AAGF50_07695 [Pseudomonadota bacterium]